MSALIVAVNDLSNLHTVLTLILPAKIVIMKVSETKREGKT